MLLFLTVELLKKIVGHDDRVPAAEFPRRPHPPRRAGSSGSGSRCRGAATTMKKTWQGNHRWLKAVEKMVTNGG